MTAVTDGDSGSADTPELTGVQRILIGVSGGLAAGIVKYLGQDHARAFPSDEIINMNMVVSILIGTAVLCLALAIVGAICTWASTGEKSRIRLLAIAVAAPSMITTYFGGDSSSQVIASLQTQQTDVAAGIFISNAHAQAVEDDNRVKQYEQPGILDLAVGGLKSVLRVGERQYWIVVGSFENRGDAKAFIQRIDSVDKGLGAFVGLKSNGFYPVLVGGLLPRSEAKEVLERAKNIDFIARHDPFLSPG
ncbi:SPOR domain-containing protein [Aestuariispira insulae]|uniref:Sporulation related protein n=1 Tax=Aestuariispira insulae TaxID=1461337 RepID=A0A3D9HGH0_9PROT|nr:SPOR domain-containing protein [Aestuariispira insulae]RED48573.1 sporulation related protein [Aestuariispira insulae]